MMDDFADRTEAPTPRRREQFRRDGQVARSQDLNASAVLIAGLLLISMIGPRLVSVLQSLMKQALSSPLESGDPGKLFSASASSVMLALAPLLLAVLAAAVVVNLAQIGFPLSFRMPRRQPGNPDPVRSTRRLFIGLIKLMVLGIVAYQLITSRLAMIITGVRTDFATFATVCIQLLLSAGMRLAIVLLIFGLLEYAVQRYQLNQKLRMTRRELQEEQRATDGDPKLKQRRRQRAKSLFQSSITQSLNRQ